MKRETRNSGNSRVMGHNENLYILANKFVNRIIQPKPLLMNPMKSHRKLSYFKTLHKKLRLKRLKEVAEKRKGVN